VNSAGAGRHLDLLAAAEEHGELDQLEFQPLRVFAQALGRGLQARDVAVVVGAEDIEQLARAALELVEHVGHVGREIGRPAVLADHDAILVVAQFGGLEPLRAVVSYSQPPDSSVGDRALQRAGALEFAFREPAVEDARRIRRGRRGCRRAWSPARSGSRPRSPPHRGGRGPARPGRRCAFPCRHPAFVGRQPFGDLVAGEAERRRRGDCGPGARCRRCTRRGSRCSGKRGRSPPVPGSAARPRRPGCPSGGRSR
jgi:hypothetical protein